MRPAFLTSPYAWTRVPRTGQSSVDQACALTVYRPDRIKGVLLAIAVGIASALALAVFVTP